MSNFLTLTKVFFLSGFNVNKRKKSQRSAFGLFGLALALFAIASFSVSMNFFMKMEALGLQKEETLGLMLLVSFMLNFVLSIYQVQSIIFNAKDYEFLESLPVKKTTIVAAKLASFYLINVAEDVALILPAIFLYLVMAKGTIIPALLALLCSLVICVIPILLSAVIGAISALVSSKSKHSNLINIIISALFFLVLFGGYLYLVYGNASGITSFMDKVFFLSWLHTGLCGETMNILYYILFSLGILFLVIVFISLIYRPVNTWLHSKNDHVDYEKVKKDAAKQNLKLDHVLLKKEWYMVSKRPQYLLNSILGSVFYLGLGVMIIFFPTMFAGGAPSEETESVNIPMIMTFMVPSLGLMMNSIATTSSSSISFESKYGYEMLKSYPIDSNKIIKAKLIIAIIISSIMNLIVSAILILVLVLKGFYQPYFIIPVIIYPQLASILLAIVGMLTGLKWPKLHFENESQVLKNSAATNFLLLFVGLPVTFLFFIVYIGDILAASFQLEFIHYIGMGLVILVYAIMIPVMLNVLKKKGARLFDNIIEKN